MPRLRHLPLLPLLALACPGPGETTSTSSTTSASSDGPGGSQGSTTLDGSTAAPTTTESTSTTTPGGPCEPGEQAPCYSGPPGTDGVGLCLAGLATCAPDGTGFGPCQGEVTPQLEDCDSPNDEDCDGSGACPAGTEQWSHHFGDAEAQWARGVAVGPDDAIVTVGIFRGSIDLGGGPLTSGSSWDTYIGKFTPAGEHLWSKALGGPPGLQGATAVCIDDAGAIYLAGEFDPSIDLGGLIEGEFGTQSAFLAKYAPDGTFQWGKGFTPSGSQTSASLSHLACDPAGGVVAGGWANDALDLGGGPLPAGGGLDVIVARFDAAGAHQWSRRFGDPDDQVLRGLARGPAGEVVLCGELSGGADFGGGPVTSAGSSDAFVARLDASGAHTWSAAFGDASQPQVCQAAAVDAQGAVFVAGSYFGAIDLGGGPLTDDEGDLFLARLDAGGAHVWSRGFGSSFLPEVHALAPGAAGDVYLYGYYSDSSFDVGLPLPASDGFALFAAKYSSAGLPLWARAYDAQGDDLPGGVAIDSAADILLTGRFESTIDFGGGPHASAGDYDVFLVKVRLD